MFCQILFYDDVILFTYIGTERLHDKQLSLSKFGLAKTIVTAHNIIGIVSYFEALLHASTHSN